MTEAVKAGNPNLAKANTPEAIEFRKNIFNKTVAPALAMVYEKRTNQDLTTTTEDVVKNNGGNKSNGSGNTVPENNNYNNLTEQVLSNQFFDSKGSLITSTGQIDQTVKENSKNIVDLRTNTYKTLKNELGLNDESIIKIFKVKSGITFDDKNGMSISPQALQELGDTGIILEQYYNNNPTSNKELFKQIQNWSSLETANKNLDGFKKQIEEISGVKDYDPKVIEAAENEAKADIYNSKFTTGGFSKEIALKHFNALSPEEQMNLIEERKEKYNNIILNGTTTNPNVGLKNKPEAKVYETIQQYQNRQSRVEVQWLTGEKQKDLQVHLQQKVDENALELIDPATNKPIRQTDEIAASFLEKTDSGIKFKDNIRFGLFVDPEGGYRGMIKVDGKRYEYKLEEGDITNFKDLDDGTKEYYKLLNQAYSSLKESYNQEGKINVGGREVSIKEEMDKSGQSNYIYTTPDGRKQTTNDVSNIINQYIKFGQAEEQIKITVLTNVNINRVCLYARR
jgi:hypothetical protein